MHFPSETEAETAPEREKVWFQCTSTAGYNPLTNSSPSLGRDQPLVHGVHAVLNWNQAPDHPTCPAFETDTAVEPNLVQTPLSPDFEVANHQEWFDEGALSSLGTPQRLNESFDDTENSVTNRTNAPCSEAFGSQHMQSLEHVPGAFTFYIGPTGASDLYLLQRQEFAQNSCTSNVATGLKFRLAEKLSRDPRGPDHPEDGNRLPPTIFGITDYSIIDNAEPRLRDDQLKGLWSELWEIVDQHAAWRLVQLYVRFVEPCFPLLASHQAVRVPDHVTSLSLALLAGMCATAVPFTMYDEALYTLLPRPPTAQQLYRICWLALWQELHAPTLQTLQACLIFQHRPPCNAVLSDTAFQWSLMSTAVSIAQTIGLHREPASWHLVPIAERKLRRRLWWALYTLEKWSALARGMPSHITEEDYDVETLDTQDLEGSFCITSVSRAHFESLVALTRILMEVQHAFYTVRATKKMSNNLHTSLEAARSLRQKLCEWNEKLPIELKSRRMGERSVGELTPQVLDSNASLFLSYIATHMTLLRALLRPLDRWTVIVKHSLQEAKTLYDASLAVVKGAIICVKELVEFVEGLRDAQWNAFWHSCKMPFCRRVVDIC